MPTFNRRAKLTRNEMIYIAHLDKKEIAEMFDQGRVMHACPSFSLLSKLLVKTTIITYYEIFVAWVLMLIAVSITTYQSPFIHMLATFFSGYCMGTLACVLYKTYRILLHRVFVFQDMTEYLEKKKGSGKPVSG